MKKTAGIIFRTLILVLLGVTIGLLISDGNFTGRNFGFSLSNNDKISKVLRLVKDNYVDTVNTDSMEGTTVNNLLQNLDPHSLYLPPQQAGQIKILGIGSEKRLKQVADIPTVAETGLPGYEATTWFGLFAPAGTPRDVVMKLNGAVRTIFGDPAFEEKFLAPQMFQSLASSPEEFEAFIKAETQKWSKVIGEAKLQID